MFSCTPRPCGVQVLRVDSFGPCGVTLQKWHAPAGSALRCVVTSEFANSRRWYNASVDISWDASMVWEFILSKTLKRKKHKTLSKSSTEAEYRALASVTSEVILILKILKDLHVENLLPVLLHCDSNSAIKIAANPVFHERTKHLEIDLHFVREIFFKGIVKTIKVDSANQIADILTKGLDTLQHKGFVEKLVFLIFTK
ncbi:hypothetical protein Tco_0692639 [Tanacetum coccineum]